MAFFAFINKIVESVIIVNLGVLYKETCSN